MCVNDWPTGSGTFRRCGLVGGIVSLWGCALKPQVIKIGLLLHSLLLPADQDVELSRPSPAPRLPACHHVSYYDELII